MPSPFFCSFEHQRAEEEEVPEKIAQREACGSGECLPKAEV
jgi:hypothetical protein